MKDAFSLMAIKANKPTTFVNNEFVPFFLHHIAIVIATQATCELNEVTFFKRLTLL